MTPTNDPTPGDPSRDAPLEKEEIRLSDGRGLTFYRFPEAPPRPAPAPSSRTGKER